MSILKTNSEFCDDLLSACIRKNLAHSGYPPIRAQYGNDGTVICTFGGMNARQQWIEKRITFRCHLPTNPTNDEITAMANPDAMAEVCGELIADIERKERSGIYRPSAFGEMARA